MAPDTLLESKAEFPEKLEELLFENSSPFKIALGGRGGSKSWAFARALLIKGVERKMRILCSRETMKSIRDSVHQLLEEQIKALNLESFYRIEKSAIYGANGTEILFAGLRMNIDNIKSMEAIDLCWVEEAQSVSKASWDKLIPTLFRVPGCELWVSFNPDLESDNTYQRFVVNPPAEAAVVKVTYRDNPWFPEGLRKLMEEDKKRNIDEYNHIWEGSTINTLANAIYANELRLVDTEGRIKRVPYDPSKPVDTSWDLGYGDMVAIWMFQAFPFEYRLIDYEEGVRQPLHYYLAELQKRGYVFGTDYLPWDGGLKALGTGKSIEEQMKAAGRKVKVAPRLPIADGINSARTVFPLCWFDEQRTAAGVRSLRMYRYGEMQSYEGPSREPLHDVHCVVPDTLVLTKHGPRQIMDLEGEEVLTPCGWSTYQGPWITRRNAQLVEVRFEDGTTVRCTPDHLFATESGWRSAESLTAGTLIQSCLIPSSSISMEGYISYGRVLLIITVALANFIERFGRALLDQFQKAATSIIATTIPPITASPIWNACPNLNMHSSPFIGTRLFPTRPEKRLPHGTVLKQASCGIGGTLKNNASGSLRIADIAALNSWLSAVASSLRDFARPSADRPAVADTQSRLGISKTSNRKTGSANPENASSVVANLWELFAAATHRCFALSSAGPPSRTIERLPAAQPTVGDARAKSASNAAPNLRRSFEAVTSTGSVQTNAESLAIASVQHLTERADTCCIQVPDIHCFALANGAIVHNSHCADSFRTMAVSIRQPQKEREKEQQRQREYASPWS